MAPKAKSLKGVDAEGDEWCVRRGSGGGQRLDTDWQLLSWGGVRTQFTTERTFFCPLCYLQISDFVSVLAIFLFCQFWQKLYTWWRTTWGQSNAKQTTTKHSDQILRRKIWSSSFSAFPGTVWGQYYVWICHWLQLSTSSLAIHGGAIFSAVSGRKSIPISAIEAPEHGAWYRVHGFYLTTTFCLNPAQQAVSLWNCHVCFWICLFFSYGFVTAGKYLWSSRREILQQTRQFQ